MSRAFAWSGTVDARYREVGRDTTGFNYMRLILAIGVLVQHSIWVVGGEPATQWQWSGPLRPLWSSILPMFFALSGFLVAGSLMRRPSVRSFMTLRFLRLVPALVVEVCLSALILGPLLTSMPIASYFSHHQFFSYFWNIVGRIHYELPGVFVGQPANAVVNKSLWTIPFELECYVILMALYLAGATTRRNWLIVIAATLAICGTVYTFAFPQPALQLTHPEGRALVVAFLFGVSARFFSDRVIYKPSFAMIAVVVSVLLTVRYETAYLAAAPLAYLTVYLGMTTPKEAPVIFSGDYSYGIYLFAFPIQQTIYQLLPDARVWWLNALLAMVGASLYAAFSWWCIESKVLAQKKRVVSFVEGFRFRKGSEAAVRT